VPNAKPPKHQLRREGLRSQTGSPCRRRAPAAPNLARPNPAAAAFQQNYRGEAKVRIEAALNAEIGFAERLTWFWSNHFCISVAKNGVRPLAGAYEREAIRPYVLGRFADMLLAAETHPARPLDPTCRFRSRLRYRSHFALSESPSDNPIGRRHGTPKT
jgi:Protein of unknown function (DUF1800)